MKRRKNYLAADCYQRQCENRQKRQANIDFITLAEQEMALMRGLYKAVPKEIGVKEPEENPEEAYRWYRKAAAAGDPDALWMTGYCVESRYGIADAALEWYEKAAAAGNEGAARDAERLRAALEQERTLDGTD